MVKKRKPPAGSKIPAATAAKTGKAKAGSEEESCPSLASSDAPSLASSNAPSLASSDATSEASCPSLAGSKAGSESGDSDAPPGLVSDGDDSDEEEPPRAPPVAPPRATFHGGGAKAARPGTRALSLSSSREAVQALVGEVLMERYSGAVPKEGYKLQVQMPAAPVYWDNPGQAVRDLIRNVADVQVAMGLEGMGAVQVTERDFISQVGKAVLGGAKPTAKQVAVLRAEYGQWVQGQQRASGVKSRMVKLWDLQA